jgi:hypothetical protein
VFRKSAIALPSQAAKSASLFSGLDRQVIEYALPPFCDIKSLAVFSRTSRLFSTYSQAALQKAKLKKLLTHVIRGEQAPAEKLLKSLPHESLAVVLQQRGKVTDYSNRTIEGTAFQLALGAEDVKLHEDEECMAEMLARYIRMLPGGEVILKNQYQEQFPEGWEAVEADRVKQDSEALQSLLDVIKAITEAECATINATYDKIQALLKSDHAEEGCTKVELNQLKAAILQSTPGNFDNTFKALISYLDSHNLIQTDAIYIEGFKALYQFRHYLECTTQSVIKHGKHFNTQLLAQAFKAYDDNYVAFGNQWDSGKNLLCWRKVIGYTQRFLPTCYAQAFSRNLYDLVERGKKLERSLDFSYGGGSFFSLGGRVVALLGYDFAVSGAPLRAGACAGRFRSWPFLQSLCREKASSLQNLCSGIAHVRRVGAP